jgi:hypothetical protein
MIHLSWAHEREAVLGFPWWVNSQAFFGSGINHFWKGGEK